LPAEFDQKDRVAVFRQGILTNVLNPKVALFFLAFLPQFIDSATPSKMPAFLLLGFTFVTTGTLWCLGLAWFAATLSTRLRGNEGVAAMLNRAVGSLFIFLGLRLAFAARR
jgi:threonine/homoserine/homoserine lactone efflux protein